MEFFIDFLGKIGQSYLEFNPWSWLILVFIIISILRSLFKDNAKNKS